MTIKEAQQIVDQWIKTTGIRYFNELTNMAQLTEDVGEVARHVGDRDDAVVHPDGYPIHALVAVDSVRLFPEVLQLQLVQEATRRFLVRYVPNRNANQEQIERKL